MNFGLAFVRINMVTSNNDGYNINATLVCFESLHYKNILS